ncbi:hypothetical protein P152DRAFT_447321 [Eremomyces bilateralis CBS 781.70]|uniref:Uncharacterized protein n=1 Tax=Eremomyces bilateralis CBS 781.70 TaxID=1392243 RepID=A0A6G1GB31_9PEZI|nr:uncharacterized protein P152DRAFT_447321 [Eremomyces bilateralis CBS 781.70]KAF1815059.1 hypothetical protein P152DRAFT_447321 [Eremomyces bilateralis CBS 781.70]
MLTARTSAALRAHLGRRMTAGSARTTTARMQWGQATGRAYSSGRPEAKSNDLIWALVATAVTAPAAYILWDGGQKKLAEVKAHAAHAHEEHAEEHVEGAETTEQEAKEEEKSEAVEEPKEEKKEEEEVKEEKVKEKKEEEKEEEKPAEEKPVEEEKKEEKPEEKSEDKPETKSEATPVEEAAPSKVPFLLAITTFVPITLLTSAAEGRAYTRGRDARGKVIERASHPACRALAMDIRSQ